MARPKKYKISLTDEELKILRLLGTEKVAFFLSPMVHILLDLFMEKDNKGTAAVIKRNAG